MKLYLAAIYTNSVSLTGNVFRRFTPVEQAARLGVKHILDSYHYIGKPTAVEAIRRDKTKVFLDSGAFSAFTAGVTIDLDEYCAYIKRNADIIEVASVLDAIGDPYATWQNQVAMEKQGVQALPCYHYGEDPRYLQHYVANYPYITLGGMVPINKEQLGYWLDDIWDKYLTTPAGLPKVKVHGFGLTRVSLMERYPWYSVDSSSWVQSAGNGGIMIPGLGTMFVSLDSPQRKEAGRHLDTLPPLQRQVFLDAIAARGFDVERLKTTYLARWSFNMQTFNELDQTDAIPKPFKLNQPTFF